MVGLSTSGNWLIPMRGDGDDAEKHGAEHQHPREHRTPKADVHQSSRAGSGRRTRRRRRKARDDEGGGDRSRPRPRQRSPAASTVAAALDVDGSALAQRFEPLDRQSSSPSTRPLVISTPPSGVYMPRETP